MPYSDSTLTFSSWNISWMIENLTWSVMVPVYNPHQRYLTEALESVVRGRSKVSKMQVEVLDDCSTNFDVQSMIAERFGEQVLFHRNSRRYGLAENWNQSVERAHGELIHILHQDDFVEDDYYAHIESLAAEHPNAGLYATRCFYVDADSTIVGVSNRVQEMETPRLGPEPFFYETPIQCSAVTVRRSAYRDLGNFRLDMGYVTDCEMWARISDAHGAVVCPGVKASFRMGHGSETSRMLRSAEAIEDIRVCTHIIC